MYLRELIRKAQVAQSLCFTLSPNLPYQLNMAHDLPRASLAREWCSPARSIICHPHLSQCFSHLQLVKEIYIATKSISDASLPLTTKLLTPISAVFVYRPSEDDVRSDWTLTHSCFSVQKAPTAEGGPTRAYYAPPTAEEAPALRAYSDEVRSPAALRTYYAAPTVEEPL